MKLENLPSGARIFIDANILIYHFAGISLECQAFLQRCESRQVEAFTGVHILLEITHRLMVLEALQIDHRRAAGAQAQRAAGDYQELA